MIRNSVFKYTRLVQWKKISWNKILIGSSEIYLSLKAIEKKQFAEKFIWIIKNFLS